MRAVPPVWEATSRGGGGGAGIGDGLGYMAMGREQCPTGLFVSSTVHFSSLPTLSLRGAFETGSSVGLIDDSSFSSFEGRSLR